MSEPEEVILDGAHHTATAIAALWRRHGGSSPRAEVRLADVRARLELFTGALFEDALPIGVAEPPAIPNLFARVAWRLPGHLVRREPIASTDGRQVRLPRQLDASQGRTAAFARYRLLATGLTMRAARGGPEAMAGIDDAMVRDLFALSESIQVDAWLARELPGIVDDLTAARREAVAAERLQHRHGASTGRIELGPDPHEIIGLEAVACAKSEEQRLVLGKVVDQAPAELVRPQRAAQASGAVAGRSHELSQ